MTTNRARKRLVRQRMKKTGESYASALRQLLANKEKSVSETNPQSRTTTCARCRAADDSSTNFVEAGLAFCSPCYAELSAAVRVELEADATRMRRPIDYFVSALVVVPDGEGWVVHLHTLQSGMVIGREGATADKIRRSLIAFKGDDRVRLNIVPHEVFGCPRPTAEPRDSATG